MEVRYYVALADPLFFFFACVCRSEVDLVIREDCYPFCSGYATKGDMSQRRKSRELSGHSSTLPIEIYHLMYHVVVKTCIKIVKGLNPGVISKVGWV